MRHRGAAVRGCAGTGLAVSVSCLLPCTQCCRGIGRRTEAWRTARLRQLLPRGAFYSLLPETGRKGPPALLKENLSIVMMVAMFAGLAQWLRPTSLRAWGMLLYIMIAITTTIGFTGPSATRNCSSKAARPSRMRQWAALPSARDCVSALAISPLVLRQ